MEETSLFSVAVRDAMTKAGLRFAGASVSEAITERSQGETMGNATYCLSDLVGSQQASLYSPDLPAPGMVQPVTAWGLRINHPLKQFLRDTPQASVMEAALQSRSPRSRWLQLVSG